MIKVLKFEADWCQPCQDQKEELKDLPFDLISVDIEKNQEKADLFEIISLPTYVILKDDSEVLRHIGTIQRSTLIDLYNINNK